MDLNEIRELAREMMCKRQPNPGREPGYIFYHGQRVAKIALQLREIIFPDKAENDQVIAVGSWFHDLGKGIEPHWEYGALLTERILQAHCPRPELDKIVEIVGNHTLRKQKTYPYYVQLVQDGDILDHFGSQEIWLNFWHTAYQRENLQYSLEFYDECYPKQVEKVRELLNFPESIQFFDEKHNFVSDFVKRLRLEGAGKLVGKREKTKG